MNITTAQMSFNLFLTLRVFSDTGGVQKVCRTMCRALTDLTHDGEGLLVFSLCDHSNDLDSRYLPTGSFKGFRYNKLWFSLCAIWKSFSAATIILSHINLMPVVILIRLIRPQARIILLVHGTEIWRALPAWKSRLLGKSIEIWSVSHFTAQKVAENHDIPLKNIKVLHNCLDPFLVLPVSFAKPPILLEKLGLKEQQPVLLLIARINKDELDKGYDQVIKCLPDLLKEFPNLCYLLGGKIDAREKQRIKGILVQNNLQQHVKILGFIPEQELSDYYLLADVFVSASTKEGFGLVLIEAAACGRQLICGNQDASKEAILNGEIGQLINPGNLNELTDAIRTRLQSRNDLNEALRIQRTCIKHFSYLLYQQKIQGLLQWDDI